MKVEMHKGEDGIIKNLDYSDYLLDMLIELMDENQKPVTQAMVYTNLREVRSEIHNAKMTYLGYRKQVKSTILVACFAIISLAAMTILLLLYRYFGV